MADAVRTSATEFKQHVGKYLDLARRGRVLIERQGRPAAVLLSAALACGAVLFTIRRGPF